MKTVLALSRRPSAAYAALALTLGACSSEHGPRAADTNTSWLRHCTQDSECEGPARCIHHLCTLDCTTESAGTCEAISTSASCDTALATCDLRCDSANQCRTLGTEHVCEGGSCRLPDAPSTSAALALVGQSLQLAANESARPNWTYVDNDVVWLGDHWRVALRANAPPSAPADRFYTLNIADVYPDERVERQYSFYTEEAKQIVLDTTLGKDGRIAELQGRPPPYTADDPCNVRFHGPNSIDAVHILASKCGDGVLPVSVDAEGDWLVLQRRGSDTTNELKLGRYSMATQRWLDEPQLLSADVGPMTGTIGAEVRDEQLWLFYTRLPGGNYFLTSVPLGEALLVQRPLRDWNPVDTRRFPFRASFAFGPAMYQQGWIVPIAYTGNSWQELDDDGHTTVAALALNSALEAVRFELAPSGSQNKIEVKGRTLPEPDLVAFCYLEMIPAAGGTPAQRKLRLRAFHADGTPRGTAATLATHSLAMESCSLSWSGSAFLASWLERDDAGYLNVPVARIVHLN